MTITAAEIVSIFKIDDQASRTLSTISDALKGLATQLQDITKQAQGAVDKLGTIFTQMGTGIKGQITQTNELAAAWDRVAASARAADVASGVGAAERVVGLPGLSGASGGHGGGIPGFKQHIRVPGPLGNNYIDPAILGGGIAGNAALAGAAAVGYGVFKDVGISHEAYNAVWAGHADEGGMPANDVVRKQIEQFRNTVITQAQANLVPYEDVAKLAAQEMRLGSGVDDQGKPYSFERRLQNLPTLIGASAAEARQKGVSLEEAGVSFIKFAHEMKEYDPAELAKIYPALSYLSTKTDQTPAAILRASGYHLPSNMGIGIDPIQDMVLQIAMERGGAINTKSGTWLAMMAKRALPYAPGTHGRGEEHEHASLLEDFGLTDENGNPTWATMGKDGKLHADEMKMLQIVHDRLPFLQQKYGAGLADAETKLFGTTGQRAVSLLADPKVFAQVQGMERGARAYNPAGYIEGALQFDPSAKFQKAWLDLQKVLIDIGEKALPLLIPMLETFDRDLTGIAQGIKKLDSMMPGWAKTAAGTVVGHLANPMSTIDDAKAAGGWVYNHLPSWPFGSHSPPHFTTDDIRALGGAEKQSYNIIPSKDNPKPITLAASLNIDGTQLAQTIASKLADIYENSPNAPTSNDASYYDSNGGIAAG